MDNALQLLLGIIARSKTVPQLTEALSINADDYVFVYSALQQEPVKIKKSNVLFPTDSFIRAANLASFPGLGEVDRLYLADDTNRLYKWDSGYVWLEETELLSILQQANDYTDLVFGGNQTRLINFNAGYDSGLTFKVTADWMFLGTSYSTNGTPVTVTLSNGDAVNDRIDVIAVTNTGTIVVLEGTPATNPSKPEVDPGTQIEGTFIIIQANATTPQGVTKSYIYNENVGGGGGEWNGTENTGTARIILNSTADPFNGTTNIEGTTLRQNDRFTLTAPALVPVAEVKQLSFRIKNKAATGTLPDNVFNITLVGQKSNGQTLLVPLGNVKDFGYNKADTTTYQFVSMPIPAANITDVAGVRFISNVINALQWGYFIDTIEITDGTPPPIEASVSKEYVDYRDSVILQQAKDYADSLAIGGGDKNYYHVQGTPASTWNITHNLNKYPSIEVLDSAKTSVEGQIVNIDTNSLTITFNASFSGSATLN